jgi:hypothetical protein
MADPLEHPTAAGDQVGQAPAEVEADQPGRPPDADEVEELDALPVLAEPAPSAPAVPALSSAGIARPAPVGLQAAAVAATGFVAGAAVVGLAHRRRQRRLTSGGRGKGRGVRRPTGAVSELVEIVGTRSLLVDVHLLGGRD